MLLGAAAVAVAYFWKQPKAVPRVSNYVQLTHDGKQKSLIGTEGSRLYFSSASSDYQGMLEMPTSGDEPKKIPVLPSPAFNPLSLSPDGSRLLAAETQVYDTGPLWSLPLLGGSPRRMGDLLTNRRLQKVFGNFYRHFFGCFHERSSLSSMKPLRSLSGKTGRAWYAPPSGPAQLTVPLTGSPQAMQPK